MRSFKRGVGISLAMTPLALWLQSGPFSQCTLPPHEPNPHAQKSFQERFGSFLKKYDGKKMVSGMIGVNALVFGAWRVPRFQAFMTRHFLCNLENLQHRRFHTLVTANWSHLDWWHVGLNMYVLWNFGPTLIESIGTPGFVSIYLLSGLVGSGASLGWHAITKMPHASSLGASSSLLGIIATFAMQFPSAQFQLIFLPFFSFSATMGMCALVGFDCIGLAMGWRFLDHAAHLGGAITGYGMWHAIRSTHGSSSDSNNLLKIPYGNYIYQGEFENFKPVEGTVGTVFAPTRTYRGGLNPDNFRFNGPGCLRDELSGQCFYGHWENGKCEGMGVLHHPNGSLIASRWDSSGPDGRQRFVTDVGSFSNEEIQSIIGDVPIKVTVEMPGSPPPPVPTQERS